MLRSDYKVEMATTQKFSFIDWTPDTLKPMRRALVSTHKEQVISLLGPFQATVQCSDEQDLAGAANEISKKLGMASGMATPRAARAGRVATGETFLCDECRNADVSMDAATMFSQVMDLAERL